MKGGDLVIMIMKDNKLVSEEEVMSYHNLEKGFFINNEEYRILKHQKYTILKSLATYHSKIIRIPIIYDYDALDVMDIEDVLGMRWKYVIGNAILKYKFTSNNLLTYYRIRDGDEITIYEDMNKIGKYLITFHKMCIKFKPINKNNNLYPLILIN